MNRAIRRSLTLTAGVVAALGGPTIGLGAIAQTPSVEKKMTSAEHLERAQMILATVPDKPKGEDADELVADLKRHFAMMVSAYRGGQAPPATTTAESQRKAWEDWFSDIERDVTKIIGAGSAIGTATAGAVAPTTGVAASPGPVSSNQPPSGATTPPVDVPAAGAGQAAPEVSAPLIGTVGAAKVATIGIKDLDPVVRKQIEQFRTALELFFTTAESEAISAVKQPVTPGPAPNF